MAANKIFLLLLFLVIIAPVFAETVSVNVDGTIRTLEYPFYGVHERIRSISPGCGVDVDGGGIDMRCNWTRSRDYMISAGVELVRTDALYNNWCDDGGVGQKENCTSYNPLVSGTDMGNISNMTQWAAQNNITMLYEWTFMPDWLANDTNSTAKPTVSPPTDYTTWVQLQQNYSRLAGCDTYDNCWWEIWNEPYLDIFWLRDVTIDASTRAFRVNNFVYFTENTLTNWTQSTGYNASIPISAVACTQANINSQANAFCSEVMGNLSDFNNTIDICTTHPYSYNTGVTNLPTQIARDADWCESKGFYKYAASEEARYQGAVTGDACGQAGNLTQYQRDIYYGYAAMRKDPRVQYDIKFEWMLGENISCSTDPNTYTDFLTDSNLENSVYPLMDYFRNQTTYFHTDGEVLDTTDSANIFVDCMRNATTSKIYCTVGSITNSASTALTFSFANGNITNMTDVWNGSVYQVVGGSVTLENLAPAEVRIFELGEGNCATSSVRYCSALACYYDETLLCPAPDTGYATTQTCNANSCS